MGTSVREREKEDKLMRRKQKEDTALTRTQFFAASIFIRT